MLCVGEIQTLLQERRKQSPCLLLLHISSCYRGVNVARKENTLVFSSLPQVFSPRCLEDAGFALPGLASGYAMAENRDVEEPAAASCSGPIISTLSSVGAAESEVHMCCKSKKRALHPSFHASELSFLGASVHTVNLLPLHFPWLIFNEFSRQDISESEQRQTAWSIKCVVAFAKRGAG